MSGSRAEMLGTIRLALAKPRAIGVIVVDPRQAGTETCHPGNKSRNSPWSPILASIRVHSRPLAVGFACEEFYVRFTC